MSNNKTNIQKGAELIETVLDFDIESVQLVEVDGKKYAYFKNDYIDLLFLGESVLTRDEKVMILDKWVESKGYKRTGYKLYDKQQG